MKDNFAGQDEEGIGQFFEKQRTEFRAQKRNERFALAASALMLGAGIYLLASFDPRLGAAALLISGAVYTFYRFL